MLNPNKFQFAERRVDFAGFKELDSTIEPLLKYLDAIRDVPSPTSIIDVRSWFGFVNQISNYAQLRDLMAPFKPFLRPRCIFSWSPELEEAFQAFKEAIVKAIHRGWKCSTYRGAHAFAPTGPDVVSAISFFSNIAVAPLAS